MAAPGTGCSFVQRWDVSSGSAASLGVCSLCALGAHNFHLSPPSTGAELSVQFNCNSAIRRCEKFPVTPGVHRFLISMISFRLISLSLVSDKGEGF